MIRTRTGEQIVRWSEDDQDCMLKLFDVLSPGFTDSEEEETCHVRAVHEDYDELIGRTVKVKDSAVFDELTQPLFAVGKLWIVGWVTEPRDA